jgi:hypothetical protein
VAQQISTTTGIGDVVAPFCHPQVQLQPATFVVSFQFTGALSARNAPLGSPAGSKHHPWTGMSAAALQLAVRVQLFAAVAWLFTPLQ